MNSGLKVNINQSKYLIKLNPDIRWSCFILQNTQKKYNFSKKVVILEFFMYFCLCQFFYWEVYRLYRFLFRKSRRCVNSSHMCSVFVFLNTDVNRRNNSKIVVYWCLYRHLCILPERFGKKDRLVRCITKDVTSRHVTDVMSRHRHQWSLWLPV